MERFNGCVLNFESFYNVFNVEKVENGLCTLWDKKDHVERIAKVSWDIKARVVTVEYL